MDVLFSGPAAMAALAAAVCILGALYFWRSRMPAALRILLGIVLVLIVLGFFGALCFGIARGGR